MTLITHDLPAFRDRVRSTFLQIQTAMCLGEPESHIDKPFTAALTATRGKRATYKVDVLPDQPAPPPIPSFQTEDDARTYWLKRRDEGAQPDELAAIQNAAPKEGNG